MTKIEIDHKDFATSLILIGIGGFLTYSSLTTLRIGTLNAMGPGAFPAGMGILLVVLGAIIGLGAIGRSGEDISLDLRSSFFILGGITAFALLARPFGLIPATVAASLLSAMASRRITLLSALFATAVITALAVGIFTYGLGVPLALIQWPFQ